jgi:hypothetical protein
MPKSEEGPCQGPEVAEMTFYAGPPPAVGWWLTQRFNSPRPVWRWWDGRMWSAAVNQNTEADIAAFWANRGLGSSHNSELKWSHYYPKDARVPRAPCPPDFEQVYDGVEHFPQMTNHIMRCCNCGTEHRMDYKVYELITRRGKVVHVKQHLHFQVGITATHLKG